MSSFVRQRHHRHSQSDLPTFTSSNSSKSNPWHIISWVILLGVFFISLLCGYCIPTALDLHRVPISNMDTTPAIVIDTQDDSIPIVIVTPTYARSTQRVDLLRMGYSLLNTPNLHWIIVEDSQGVTSSATDVINRIRSLDTFHVLTIHHIFRWTPKDPVTDKPSVRHRGVEQRNAGIEYALEKCPQDSVLYFGDDDNTYDRTLFQYLRRTTMVSVFPVGFASGLKYEIPVTNDGVVSDWRTGWRVHREFAIDMAGFAVSLELIRKNSVLFRQSARPGYLEDDFILQCIPRIFMALPIMDHDPIVRVWHTKLRPNIEDELLLGSRFQVRQGV